MTKEQRRAGESGPAPGGDPDSHAIFLRWKEVESVAMHFNELLLSFRLRALGALSIAAGVFGTLVVSKDVEASPQNFYVVAVAMAFLGVVWVSIWALDSLYYQSLLHGAIDEAVRLEKRSKGDLGLSLGIEARFALRGKKASRLGRRLFYFIPLAAFLNSAGAAVSLGLRDGYSAWYLAILVTLASTGGGAYLLLTRDGESTAQTTSGAGGLGAVAGTSVGGSSEPQDEGSADD